MIGVLLVVLRKLYECLKNKFNIESFLDYHAISIHIKTLILVDMFEFFRNICMEFYSLDPSHVFTGSRFTLDCAFFYNRVRVQLVRDETVKKLTERGLRGAVVLLSESYLKANTKRFGKFDDTVPTLNILHVDSNGQYSDASRNKLPESDFHYHSREELGKLDIPAIDANGEFGYILDVEIHIPYPLNFQFQSYPPVCEKRLVEIEMLSSSQRDTASKLNLKIRLKEERLLSTLLDKPSNVHYISNLQFFLSLGIQIRRINEGVRYRQAYLFKKYIEFNADQRIKAESKLTATFFKNLKNYLTGRLSLQSNIYPTNKFCRSST